MRSLSWSLTVLLLAAPSDAQTAAPSAWTPWLGCWELTVDAERDASMSRSAPAERGAARRIERPRICVTAADEGGARFVTTIAGQPAVDYTTVPDGRERPLAEGQCRGTQRAEWSADGLRLFTRAELACEGDPAPRRISGLSLFEPNGTWLDIQAVDLGGRETVRVRRYFRAQDQPPLARAFLSASALTLDDVKEASAKVTARALEAALVESHAGFNLTADAVTELDDAAVPDSVIDLMVALSYPDRFVIERTRSGTRSAFGNDPFMLGWAFGYPVWYDDYFYSPYYYMPFGYSSYALRGYGGPYGGDVIVVNPSEPRPSGAGRVVDGQGYTRVRTREAAIDDEAGGPRTSSTSAPATSGGSTTSSTSSTASSGGGYAGGGSSSDTGRTAQPR